MMTLNKTTLPKPTVQVSLQRQLASRIKELGFGIDKNVSEDHANYRLTKKNGDNTDLYVAFNVRTLEHCCGVREAGDLEVTREDVSTLSKVATDALEILLAIAFLDIREKNISKSPKGVYEKILTCRPIIFCSNTQEDCKIFDSAARKYLKGYYKLVSTTRNPGSNNVIKTYISQ